MQNFSPEPLQHRAKLWVRNLFRKVIIAWGTGRGKLFYVFFYDSSDKSVHALSGLIKILFKFLILFYFHVQRHSFVSLFLVLKRGSILCFCYSHFVILLLHKDTILYMFVQLYKMHKIYSYGLCILSIDIFVRIYYNVLTR